MISFFIPGKVQAKQSARFTRHGRAFTPEAMVSYENLVKMTAAEAMGGKPPTSGPVCVAIDIFLPVPKTATKKLKADIALGLVQPCKKPDVDNAVKGILDGMRAVAYEDDVQVVSLEVTKRYASESRPAGALIEVWEWNHETV